MKNFGLLGAFDIAQKRALIAELKAEIKKDMESKKAYKASLKEEKAAARESKKAAKVAALQAKIDALLNPVGTKAVKANRKAGPVTVTKFA